MISSLKQLVVALVLPCSIDLVILAFVVSMLYKGYISTIKLILEEAEKADKMVFNWLGFR